MGAASFNTEYKYKNISKAETTPMVESINNNGKEINYTYDKNGNIETITSGDKTNKYYYNELSELIREDNKEQDRTYVYSYDAGGNILGKTEYAYTTGTPSSPLKTVSYTYGDSNWKDKLTNFNGKKITYDPNDPIGNPQSYDGWKFTWEQGRQLASMKSETKNISYKYDDSGIRTEKTVNGVVTKYHLVGDKVTYEDNGTDKIYYTYDSKNDLVSMNLNGVGYYYIRNAQNDIIGLFDKTGAQVVSYSYDSWGKLISIDGILKDSVGVKNPYRYRGYRYDTETGLYYLQSRYYNAEWGRFINADEIAAVTGDLLSANMFAYCQNSPINYFDPNGFQRFRILNDGGNGESFEDDYEYRKNARDRNSEDNPLGDRETKNRDRRQVNRNLGKRGSKEREEKSVDMHKGKKKNGKKKNNNFNNKDMENGNYYGCNLPAPARLGIGIALICGTIVEDILTGGAGIVDDGVTISAGVGIIIKAF